MVDNFLKHHGILGMKWGVRRYQNKDGSLTAAGRKRRGLSKPYDLQTKDGDLILKKGSTIKRMTADPNEKNEGHLYGAFTKHDVAFYRNSVTSWLYELSDVEQTFQMNMKAKNDLVIPSEKKKIETFMKLMNDKKVPKELIRIGDFTIHVNDQTNRQFYKISSKMQKLGMRQDAAETYALFSMGLHTSPKIRDSFFKELKKQGYNAVIDTEDAFVMAEKPIIVFDRQKDLNTLSVVKLPKKWSKRNEDEKAEFDKIRKESYDQPLEYGKDE